MTPETFYWAAAVGLVADEVRRLTPEEFPGRRDKLVATLLNAARRLGGPEATNGQPVPPESIHDVCHNLHGTVDAKAFAAGCAAEQRRLYGCAPDHDLKAMVRSAARALCLVHLGVCQSQWCTVCSRAPGHEDHLKNKHAFRAGDCDCPAGFLLAFCEEEETWMPSGGTSCSS